MHQKSIKLFFFNAGVTYKKVFLPNIQSDSISNNLRRRISLLLPNEQKALSLQGSVSQYIFPFKTKLGFRVQWQKAQTAQLLNRDLIKLKSEGLSANYTAVKRFGNSLELNHQAEAAWYHVHLVADNRFALSSTKIFSFNQQLNLTSIIAKKIQLGITATHRINKLTEDNKMGYFFTDAVFKKLALLKGLDVELDCLNLFDVREYLVFIQQTSQLSISRYPLRGRTILLRLNYIF